MEAHVAKYILYIVAKLMPNFMAIAQGELEIGT